MDNTVKNLNGLDLSALDKLSPAEKELALSILKEYSESGASQQLNDLVMEDYAEMPVDILTFVDDNEYLGHAWHDAEGKSKLYPYWRTELKKIFPDNLHTSVNNVIFSGSRGRGKAQPLDSKIFTDKGYIRMGDIQVGDLVYGNDGITHKVLGIYPQGQKDTYRVTFSDHSSTECSDEHLWTVLNKKTYKYETLELKDIIANYNDTLYELPELQPLKFEENSHDISPYEYGYLINSDKILDEYLYDSIQHRTELLKGILNNSQISNKNIKSYRIFSTNIALIEQIKFIIQSLGGTCYLYRSIDVYFLDDIQLPKITAQSEIAPKREVINIEYLGKKECQCIYIDSNDHLYLTDDLIITHNTEIAVLTAAYMLHRVLCLKDPIGYFHLKPTEKLVFAFMNIKLALAEEIGIAKFQNTIQSSPWFMAHGELEGRTKKIWVPKKFNGQVAIDIKIGSQSDDLIGLPVYFCLDGETPILTSDGVFNIQDLENKKIRVPSISNNGKLILSDECTVKQTTESDIEYQIELEDRSIIKCTPNHRFMLKDGTYKEAQYLTVDDELFDAELLKN